MRTRYRSHRWQSLCRPPGEAPAKLGGVGGDSFGSLLEGDKDAGFVAALSAMNQELQRKYRLAGTGPAHQQRRAPARQSAGGNFIDPAMPVGALLLFRRIKSTDLMGGPLQGTAPAAVSQAHGQTPLPYADQQSMLSPSDRPRRRAHNAARQPRAETLRGRRGTSRSAPVSHGVNVVRPGIAPTP